MTLKRVIGLAISFNIFTLGKSIPYANNIHKKHQTSIYYCRYLSLGSVRNKEMSRKMHAMYQSVLKVEKVCYNIKVRGSEAAIWSSNDGIEKERDDEVDEGFANY